MGLIAVDGAPRVAISTSSSFCAAAAKSDPPECVRERERERVREGER